MSYEEEVRKFNEKAEAAYIPEVHFLTFRHTRKGILVGFTAGRRSEIVQLGYHVWFAGKPYYMKDYKEK